MCIRDRNVHVLVTDAGKTCIQVIDDGKGDVYKRQSQQHQNLFHIPNS